MAANMRVSHSLPPPLTYALAALMLVAAASACAVDYKDSCSGTTCCATTSTCTLLPNHENIKVCIPAGGPSPPPLSSATRVGVSAKIPAKKNMTAAVIMLHGVGYSGPSMMKQFLNALGPSGLTGLGMDHVTFYFPSGFVFKASPILQAVAHVTNPVLGWYDLVAASKDENMFGLGFKSTAADVSTGISQIQSLIANIVASTRISPDRIIVAGFSQGGTLALNLGMFAPKPLAGVVGMSTATLPPPVAVPPANRDTPVLIAHGKQDQIVPLYLGQLTTRLLQPSLGISPYLPTVPVFIDLGMTAVKHREYDMVVPALFNHDIITAEAQDVAAFIASLLPP